MLIKEYRIPLPLTVKEYRIAQLYMIAKKSREESSGAGSGVEILVNEPYVDGPGGGCGQYTHKIYHVGSHLPGWLKGILPKTALMVDEKAWNAYPYTKTRYTCPFVEKFSLEIETYYFDDNGHQENVFNLTGSDLRNRQVDVIDVVRDHLYGADYVRDEDPLYFVSEKTGRGPLDDNWLEEYWQLINSNVNEKRKLTLMCAYKLCRVEFRYWGMQTKIERFIHDVALRKTMLRAHRQAWAWQDEWCDLTMNDIREIERQTQQALKRKMANSFDDETDETSDTDEGLSNAVKVDETTKTIAATFGSIEVTDESPLPSTRSTITRPTTTTSITHNIISFRTDDQPLLTKITSPTSPKAYDPFQVANWRMATLGRDSDESGTSSRDDAEDDDNEQFFDCEDTGEFRTAAASTTSLAKWSSLELLPEEGTPTEAHTPDKSEDDDSIFSSTFLQRVASERTRSSRETVPRGKTNSIDSNMMTFGGGGKSVPGHLAMPCSTTVLLMVLHSGSVLDGNVDVVAKKSDVSTMCSCIETVIRQHYTSLLGHVAVRMVSCPSICMEGLAVLSSLSPYSFDVSPSCTMDTPQITHDSIPIGAIPILATSNLEYSDCVCRTIMACNLVYQEFIRSPEGNGFAGQICIIADSLGSILAYDALCKTTITISDSDVDTSHQLLVIPTSSSGAIKRSTSADTVLNHDRFDFEVGDFFMFGSPLALVLAYRRIQCGSDDRAPGGVGRIYRPNCAQVYNLFHPTDPVAARLEPLLSARFAFVPPINIPRYIKYPLGNGQPYHLLDILQSNPQVLNENLPQLRRLSDVSLQSTMSGINDNVSLQALNNLNQKWWGSKRLDYALYCPEGLANFPTNALPHLFHASYWESGDVIAFILRQIGGLESILVSPPAPGGGTIPGLDKPLLSSGVGLMFRPAQPREKWLKKRTSVKVKNTTANHRGNDVICREGMPQVLSARFVYGPLDMVALTGERVDCHVMKDAPAGEWHLIGTEVTDKTGRVTVTIPAERSLTYGIYPVKMVVRGDHTFVDFFLAVVPPKTESVVFSIDGSFTASVSVSGRDPKVRASAVDVVRHWQELGYLIIYVTGRPDMQHRRVVSWLSQHNFPHGLVSFADGLSTDPLGHKTTYLSNLIQKQDMVICAGYGSSKDIAVYTAIDLKPRQIFIIGKTSKKQQSQATVLSEGYAAHLAVLMAPGGSRPAQGNARMVIPRGYFGLPGQGSGGTRRRSRSAKRATSCPMVSDEWPLSPLERSLSAQQHHRRLPKASHLVTIHTSKK